jgi:site-specific recombinase XerD
MSVHPHRGGDSHPAAAPLSGETLAEEYKQAGKSQNTDKAYSQAVDHFRNECHGFLPATENEIGDYIAKCAGKYSVSTIKLRLAGLSAWHKSVGFKDPTKSAHVKDVLRGIAKKHNKPPREATPLPFDYLKQMVLRQEQLMAKARSDGNHAEYLRRSRDVALLLMGFWRGFRSDELCRLEVQFITVYKGSRIEIYLPYSKTDNDGAGVTFSTAALKAFCPVQAYCRWIEDAGIATGSVFRAIDRWGNFGVDGVTGRSIGPILNGMVKDAGLDIHLSTHSLRRGFAKWAADHGWDVHSVMAYVGWKNYESAKRYIPPRFSFGELSLDHSMSSLSNATVPSVIDASSVVAEAVKRGDNG